MFYVRWLYTSAVFVLLGDYQNSRRYANFTVCDGMYKPLVNGLHKFVLELILELQLDFQNDFIHGRESFEDQGLNLQRVWASKF